MKKYILILVSVFAFGQASNQMVTFTQAQSLGFALNSGQSHVTSNQCMTKSDVLTKYNIDASAMSSYANNQLVPRSAWVNNVWAFNIGNQYSSSSEGINGSCISCAYPGQSTIVLYAKQSNIINGTVLYSDANATIPYVNGNYSNQFYKNGSVFSINNTGVVSDFTSCTVGFSNSLVVSNTKGLSEISGNIFIHNGPATFKAFAKSSTGSPVSVSITIGGVTENVLTSGVGTSYSTSFSLPSGAYDYTISYYQLDNQIASGGIQFTQP